jgi:protein transport protein SEC24
MRLQRSFGGKLVMFQTCLPTVGPGKLKSRFDPKLMGTEKEKTLYEPQDYFWRKIAQDYVVSGISCDLYAFPNTYVDLATLGTLPAMTAGNTYWYPSFNAEKDGMAFVNDLFRTCTRPFGYEGLLRLRCSAGLKIDEHIGNFYMRNATDVELAGIDSQTAVTVTFKHDGKLDEKVDASFQSALLYTTADGQRRVRVLNVVIPCTDMLGSVYKLSDMDTAINILAKKGVFSLVV